ncbi:MAG: flavin reductase [Chloroflexi bacterium RBG_16_57_9]|nr:MAG: flavin reductase [Chloroflexi bacterium RBG_16_57_9]
MDLSAKRRALQMLTYGLYVVTTIDEDWPHAATITWLSQASFDPPLIMVAIRTDGHLHMPLEHSRTFVVNILAAGQATIAERFFRPRPVEGKTIGGLAFESGETGAPILLDAPAYLECLVIDTVKRGDHTIFVGQIVNAGVRQDSETLELRRTGWTYGG